MNDTVNTSTDQAETAATSNLPVNPNPFLETKEFKFGFRTMKDKDTGVETKRPDVEVKLAMPSFEGIVKILEGGGKPLDLLYSAMETLVKDRVKSDLGDDEKITTENFDPSKYLWDVIANEPESERKGRGIAKEVWDDFIKSYIADMPALTGKAISNIETQAKVLLVKFAPLKNHEDKERILQSFKTALTVYMNGSKDAEKYAACIEFLQDKADSMLKTNTAADLASNLGF